MATTYTVHRAFAREVKSGDETESVYFTRENADRLAELSQAERKRLVEAGYISEHDDKTGTPSAPAAPATSKGGK